MNAAFLDCPPTTSVVRRPGSSVVPLGLAIWALLWFPLDAEGQGTSATLAPDPAMPVREGFDVSRAIFWAESNFEALRDPRFESLGDVLRSNRITDSTPVVTFQAGGQTLALVSSQIAYHHVVQGEMAGEPWMVTF